jgi:hypothetical protein
MVDLWSKWPIQKLWQLFKSISMQNFIFSNILKYFSIFILSYWIIQLEKEFKEEKSSRAVSLRAVLFLQHSRPRPLLQAGRAVSSPGSLPRGPRCRADPACQPHSFVGGYLSASDPISRPLPFQTHPLSSANRRTTRP